MKELASIRAAALGNILQTVGVEMNGSDDAIEVSNACTRAIAASEARYESLVAQIRALPRRGLYGEQVLAADLLALVEPPQKPLAVEPGTLDT